MSILIAPKFCHLVRLSDFFVRDFTGLPGHVDVKTGSFATTYELRFAVFAPWKESHIIIPMKAHVKHLIRVVKDVLGAISMVNVPIDNQNFLALISSILGRYRNIIKEAEAMLVFRVRMVSWRPHNAVTPLI